MDDKLPIIFNGSDYVMTMAGIRQVEREIERLQVVVEAARAVAFIPIPLPETASSGYVIELLDKLAVLKDALAKVGKGE